MTQTVGERAGQELAGRRLLLAEDEPFIALDLQTILEGAGADVTVVPDVRSGLSEVERGEPYDAAVLDVRLKDGEVYPLAERLIEGGVTIVFHSGHAHGRYLAEAFPDAPVLTKPAARQTLVDVILRAMSPSA